VHTGAPSLADLTIPISLPPSFPAEGRPYPVRRDAACREKKKAVPKALPRWPCAELGYLVARALLQSLPGITLYTKPAQHVPSQPIVRHDPHRLQYRRVSLPLRIPL